MSTIPSPSIATDFGGLTRLKAQAAKDPAGQARTVAGQFESLFLQQMIKSMRAASPGDPLINGAGMQMFRDMQDQQLALNLANSGGMGIADFLVRQLSLPGGASTKVLPPRPDGFPSLDLHARRAQEGEQAPEAEAGKTPPAAERPSMPVAVYRRIAEAQDAPAGAQGGGESIRWQAPEDFVRDLMPHAQAAAARLGVDPQVLIAQSALETGWGRHLPSDAEGRPSLNLFGIKANGGWEGGRAVASTLEYEDGAMVQKREAFRAYDSIRAAFDDYVDFLTSNPRYAGALEHAGDSERFVQELQKAGYATDPAYADKILSILRTGPLSSTA